MTTPAWMAHAWGELGQRERPGASDNERITRFFADVGHPEIDNDEVAWCAAFAGACLERAGLASTRSLMARSYLRWGELLDAPRFGAVAVFSRGSDPAAGHVGFWIGETADDVVLLGGNQSDSVSVMRLPKAQLLGLRWPPGSPAPLQATKPRPAAATPPIEAVFERALVHVLQVEGGYSDDPHDPGGPTNRGVTLAVFARHVGVALNPATRPGLVARLKVIDEDTVRAIYETRYWRPSRAPEMPAALALMHFDAAVNHGVTGAARLLQRALGVAADGEVGPVTLAAARNLPISRAIDAYADVRRRRYRELPHFWRFGRGWLARVDQTVAAARSLAGSPARPSSTKGDEPMPSANEPEAEAPTAAKWWGNSITIWGAIITGVTTVLPVVAPLFGLNVTGEIARQLGEQLVAVGQAVGGLVGTALTIWGRSRAATRLERREMRFHM